MPKQTPLQQSQNNSNLSANEVDPCAEMSASNRQLQQQLAEKSRLLEQAQQRVLELEEKNYFINSLIQHLPTPIFVKEAKELRFVSWNKASEELFGLKEEQVLGKNDYDFFPQQEADFFTDKDRFVLTSNQILDIPEEPIHTANQGTHFLHTKKVPILGPDGQPKYLLAISEDITTRKQNEEALRSSEARNRALLNAFPDLVMRLQRDGTYLDVKPAKDVSAIAPPSELIGKKVSQVLPPEMAERRMHYIEQVLQTGQPQSLEQQLFRDNQLHDEELRIVPSGEDEVLIIVRDITERKQAERQLRQNQALLQAIIDNTAASIYVLDTQGRFLLINNTFANLFNLDKKAVIGKTDYDIFPQDAAQGYQSSDLEILKTGIPVQLEEFVSHEDGLHTYITLKFPLFDETGRPFAICGMSTDITERKRAEENLAKRATELETVAEVGTAVSTILEIDALLQLVVDLAKSRFNLYHAHIYLLNPAGNTLTLAAATGEVGQKMLAQNWQILLAQEHSLVARAARTRQGVIANNVRSRFDFLANPLLPETQAEMAIPIIAGNSVLGVLDVQSDKLDYFTNEDIRVQSVLADQVAAAIQNARLFQEIQLALNETEALNRIARTLGQLTDIRALAETALLEYLYILDLPQGGVLLFDEHKTNGTLVALVQHSQLVEPGLSIPIIDNPSYEELLTTREPVIINDALHDALLEPVRELVQGLGIKSLLLVPVIVRGQMIGALGADSTETLHEFTAREVALVQSVADQLGIAIENLRLLEGAQARARREQLLREVTTRVRSAIDAETIMRTAVQEVGRTLGRPAFIYLGNSQPPVQEEANQPVWEGN